MLAGCLIPNPLSRNGAEATLDQLRAALQAVLDACGDGYTLDGFVVVMGLERIGPDGIETVPWWTSPADQPQWVTDGLVLALDDMRSRVERE